MVEIVRLPYLGSAETDVLFAEWVIGPGEAVRKGQTLALVETLKATFEVEAGSDGLLLRQLVGAGERVPMQAPVGVLGAAGEEPTDEELSGLLTNGAERVEPDDAEGASTSDSRAAGSADSGRSPARSAGAPVSPVAPAARRRAAELGLDVTAVTGTGPEGLVRVADVEHAAARGPGEGTAERTGESTGELDPEFLAQLRADRAAFARLSSELKVILYRRFGARIGADCNLGPGTVLVAERLVLGDGAHFGADCSLEARDFEAGRLLHFGPRCRIRCTRVRAGDNAFFAEDVEIGGGGALDPEAELSVGSHGFIGEHVHLNPCRPLRIGDEVVISRSAVVMTHSFGASVLQGYPNRFAGIEIGDRAQLGIGATLFPGVEVGVGSILMSGSSLVSSVPAGRLYGGVPAVDLKAAAAPVSPEEFVRNGRELVREFARQLAARGMTVSVDASGADVHVTVEEDGVKHRLRFQTDGFEDENELLAEELRVAPHFDSAVWDELPPDVVGVDFSVPAVKGPSGPLADAFREFLRKRGVRLKPRTWSYRGGWL